MSKIRIGIVGYGNLGRGVEAAVQQNPDTELVAVFTRRDPKTVTTKSNVEVLHVDDAPSYQDKIDVMILCGGSATDLPEQGPHFAQYFNTIDSFDTHARIPEYFEAVNAASEKAGKVAIISVGWDPGLFSLNRLLGEEVLPVGNTYTFWGKGVSQGHSDAIRRIKGVKNAVQYTIPIEEAVNRVRRGENPELSTREKHARECFVVLEEGADPAKVEHEIKTMPNYFDEYDTTVHFISEEELKKNHSGMPHGGFVIRSGVSGLGDKQIMEFSLNLESNPMFTSSVLVAYARAAYRLNQKGDKGAKTVFDIPFGLLSPKSPEELRKDLL
ncbi:diaminopimelate dehydrogenase [Ureibacillus sp. FSL K6-8385]|uniref:Meso-diaminopimelate D-dehydrogenase n=1 Tax=Ureibacillus terrenus TaxID=118246 RepID=A0A540UVL2_9BACL|nr:diaminopimelate dehydrogenase [Ureibacillus terrenus]MED3660894.1 diaminopimelate dehydrogenase [Ureibacillus terrenus]MED3764607.1 diaminopimelate dehydrogenase [Ureibacillus terrenus]TQE88529.1 diaminopimelate dehydrogenase [Ureibacillus terrenus]